MPGRFPIFKLLIYFLLHIDVFLTVLIFLAGITLKICEFQVRFTDYYCQKSDYPMKIRNFAFRLPRFVPLRVTAAGRSYIGKRTSTLILGFQKIWPFSESQSRIVQRWTPRVCLYLSGSFQVFTLEMSLRYSHIRRGVFVAQSTVMARPNASESGVSNTRLPLFFL